MPRQTLKGRKFVASPACPLPLGQVVHGDCLTVMGGWPSGCIDLVYADPPFCTGRDFGSFDDRWRGALPDEAPPIARLALDSHSLSMGAYLAWLHPRLLEIRRLLKPTGSLYLHCDPTAGAYLKTLMDATFGKDGFRNEIVWCYAGGGVPRKDFPRKHDTILRYAGDGRTFNVERRPYSKSSAKAGRHSLTSGGKKLDLKKGTPVNDWWADVKIITSWGQERIGYPTQKPLALLDRIILASSNPGDVVLDPFCGSGTTLVAAQGLKRKWVGIDAGEEAVRVACGRLGVCVGRPCP